MRLLNEILIEPKRSNIKTYFLNLAFASVCVDTVEYDVRTDDSDPPRDPIDSSTCVDGLTATN